VPRLSRAQAVEWVRDRLAGLTGTRWVGIDGLGAAGKTSFAAEIAALVPQAHIVHVDDFARPSVMGWDRARFVSEVLEPLRGGRPAHYARWDYLTDERRDWADVPPGVPVIVEGVSATDERLPVPWDITLWLDAPEEIRRRRIEERDDDRLLYRWQTDWWPSEQAYLREQRPKDRPGVIVVSE
jgi:uridine kinase